LLPGRGALSFLREERVNIQTSPNWLEIDLSAIRGNVAALQRFLGEHCKVLAVVKANAYGHGAQQAARAALEGGAWGLCVASLPEAREIRRGGIDAPLLLLNSGRPEEAVEVVHFHLIQALYSREMAEALSRAALRIGYEAEAHLKVDTGMGRLGVRPEEALRFASEVAGFPALRLTGVFSHLATAEEADETFARAQFQRFRACLDSLASRLPGLNAHIANSAATLKFPQMHLDMVRAGLLIYGVYPTFQLAQAGLHLRPALTWKTRIAFVKTVAAGTPISYGSTWRANSPTTIATLPVGYSDGYPRALSNRGQVLLRGRLKPVVGRVCMNHTLLDIGEEPEVRPGEEVVLIGQQEENRLTVNHLAEWGETVPHEILGRLGRHLPRVYVK